MQHEPIRVLHMIASLNIGGSQSFVMNLYRNIDREKIQFDFIIDKPDETELKDEIESLGGRVYVLPTFKGINILEVRKAWDNFFFDHPKYKLWHTHSRSYASVYLPIAKKYGLITIAHSHSTSNGSGKTAWIKDLMQLPIRYQADYLFACSQEAGDWLFGKKATRSERFKVIPNAIDAKKFAFDPSKREKIRSELGLKDSYVLGHVGRMTEPKNHMFLLQVFKSVREKRNNAKLLLIGDGELMEKIKAEAGRLGVIDDVLFMGTKSNTYDYYQAMDVFAFPSLWEGLPVTIVEAQSAGLPCYISSNISDDVCISSLVHKLPIDEGVNEWVYSIINTKINMRFLGREIQNTDFDIQKATELVSDIYCFGLCDLQGK